MSKKLEGKVAVVTGASRGIGKATALATGFANAEGEIVVPFAASYALAPGSALPIVATRNAAGIPASWRRGQGASSSA